MNKEKVYRIVRTAINNGTLVRPISCQRCRQIPMTCSDGRAPIHAHHHDYGRPLDVEWICAKCHRAETPLPNKIGAPSIGESNGQSKLTEADVISARRMRSDGATYKAIAKRFAVCRTTAMRAIKGELWSHVEVAAAPSNPTTQPPEGR